MWHFNLDQSVYSLTSKSRERHPGVGISNQTVALWASLHWNMSYTCSILIDMVVGWCSAQVILDFTSVYTRMQQQDGTASTHLRCLLLSLPCNTETNKFNQVCASSAALTLHATIQCKHGECFSQQTRIKCFLNKT